MGSPLDSSQFVRLLDTRLREVSEGQSRYDDLSAMIPKFFRTLPSDSAWEEFYGVGNVPDIPEFNGKLTYLSIAPGYYFKIEPKEFGAGINAERKLIDDKKYSALDGRAKGLMQACNRTREKWAVRVWDLAFSSAFDFMNSEENLSLCNSSHTTKSGTSTTSGFNNSGTTKFSKLAVATTRLAMRLFRDDISERIEISDNLALIVPDAIADDAYELNKTRSGMDSGEGNVNMAYGRYEVIPYMRLDDNSTTNWFMADTSRMKQDLIWIDRISPEPKNTVDYETYMLKQAIYARFGYGWIGWRWLFGHVVS